MPATNQSQSSRHPIDAGPATHAPAPGNLRPEEFRSIVFGGVEETTQQQGASPEFFRDLNLDQLVATIVARKGAYDLEPFFWTPLRDVGLIEFRQEVFADLERADICRLAALRLTRPDRFQSWLAGLTPIRSR